MNPLILAQEIIDGRRITREDDLSFFLTCDLDELCEGADRIREAYIRNAISISVLPWDFFLPNSCIVFMKPE